MPVSAPDAVMVATPEELTAARGMSIIRTPVAGAARATTVPALPNWVVVGSATEMFEAVPVVMIRMITPWEPNEPTAMVSDAEGVWADGVVPAWRID